MDLAPARRPTMKDVAALAGVSLSTVSRTVNDDPGVRPDLAAKVRHAVKLLGYQRDEGASALRRSGRVSASLGIIVEDVANPFFSAVHRGIEDFARSRGFLTFAGSSDDDGDRERVLAEAFVARRVDGLLIAPAGRDHRFLERERAAGVPLVFVDRPARWLEADAVVSDNAGGADMAIEHLIAAGHRRIAFLGDRPELFTTTERFAGYRAALERAGLALDEELVRLGLDERAAYAAARDLLALPKPPTALFSAQNFITIGVLRAAHELDVRGSVAHVGFDDVALSDLLAPALTVIAQDPYELGRVAAELVFSRLDGEGGPPRRVLLPTRLVPRGSGELPAP
jgi:LacI family transcriptional regulator